VPTLFNQLDAAGVSWKGYAQDLGNPDTDRRRARRRHAVLRRARLHVGPTGGSGTTYPNPSSANATDQYVPKHFPFPWFESILQSGDCNSAHIANLFDPTDGLYHDLQSEATTPAFSWISPNNCSDGHDAVCARQQPVGRVLRPEHPERAGQLHGRPVLRRPVPRARDSRDRGVAGVQGRRPDRHHLRRGLPAVHLQQRQLRQLDDVAPTRRPRSRRLGRRDAVRPQRELGADRAEHAAGQGREPATSSTRARATTSTSTARALRRPDGPVAARRHLPARWRQPRPGGSHGCRERRPPPAASTIDDNSIVATDVGRRDRDRVSRRARSSAR
jgi:hypothetical protein